MTTFAQCADCSGQIIVGQYDPITVPRIDEDGFPLFDGEGNVLTIRIPLPAHRAHTRWAHQQFDPSGLAPSFCTHGLPEHPQGFTHPWARSWVRAKYLESNPARACPVCRGEPRPDDMTEPLA